MTKHLGIIQSRGLGDLVIALPIAHYYHKEGYQVSWPICQEFLPSMQPTAPWVNWIPIPTDPQGRFFYDEPLLQLQKVGCRDILPLYNALTGHPEFSQEVYFQHTKFDQYKYHRAGVPFHYKWRLKDCITRNPKREQDLYNQLVKNPQYAVLHLEGSDHKTSFDLDSIPKNWQIIEIKPLTDNIFDWLTILERAQSLIMIDSVYANLIDQLNIGDDRYYIPRSHIQLTPVLGQQWTWIPNPQIDPRHQIFRAS